MGFKTRQLVQTCLSAAGLLIILGFQNCTENLGQQSQSNQSASVANLTPQQCLPTAISDCVLPQATGNALSGSCQSPAVGSCSFECTNGQWQVITNTCQVAPAPPPIVPGSQMISAPGGTTFTVPPYNQIVVQVWGAGGGGGDATADNGASGGASTFDQTVNAGGGTGGPSNPCASTDCPQGPWSVGGTATGGSVNINGNSDTSGGVAGIGGNGLPAPNGGAGGAFGVMSGSPGGNGGTPGGGGGGGHFPGGDGFGGGSGAYVEITYTTGQLVVGASIPVVVGAGGAGGQSSYPGGAGGNGQVIITWQ